LELRSVAALAYGAYLRLRRLADDGGRFMLVDLRGAEPETLADLLVGLAPFATGAVVEADAEQAVWRRHGSPHIGRLDACGEDPAALTLAQATAADGILGPTAPPEFPRFGSDAAADIGLDRPGRHGWLRTTVDPDALTGDGVLGYLAPGTFWREALRGLDRPSRCRTIADALVPRLQALNGVTADLPPAAWLAS
jgi:hypothetical protein